MNLKNVAHFKRPTELVLAGLLAPGLFTSAWDNGEPVMQ
jgi:hypothetical protein